MKNVIGIFALAVLFSGIILTSCQDSSQKIVVKTVKVKPIVKEDIIKAQKIWGDAIVNIGNAYNNKEDYKALAETTVDELYGFDEGKVLFKPTKASEFPFRFTEDEAISYFVEGVVAEDQGFAIHTWSNVRFENAGIIINDNAATAMGNYYFTESTTGEEVKVEYTLGYFKNDEGKLLINVHHSSLPYKPAH
jgi:hypothetical protein